jgi:indolepyruvate ferredoxin oxidoreductase
MRIRTLALVLHQSGERKVTRLSTTIASSAGRAFALDDRYRAETGSVYLTGVQALVRMLIDRSVIDRRAGSDVSIYVTGYEGSPLAGYDLEVARNRVLLDRCGVVHRPALNEEMAATSLMGSQVAAEVATLVPDGVTGIWYGKAPGLDRATDAIRHANLAGTHPRGGVVALVGDDPSAKSSSVPCASEYALADLNIPTFYPADSDDVLEFARHAVEMSRASGLWTAIKVATNVADGASTAELGGEWRAPDLSRSGLRPYTHQPSTRLLGANLLTLERSMYDQRLPLALEYTRLSGLNRISGATDQSGILGIVAAGKTYLDVRQALTSLGLGDDNAMAAHGIRLLKLGIVFPLEPTVVEEFSKGLDEILVIEDKRPFLEAAIKDVLYGQPNTPRIFGKRGPDGASMFPPTGELDPDLIARRLAPRLRELVGVQSTAPMPRRLDLLPLAARTPYFCSGCPHNSSTKTPDSTMVGAGIGCHSMVLFMQPDQVGDVVGLTQMGGEGAQWFGMAPFVTEKHFVQNIGDGTFAHSGSLAIRAAVAAKVDITYKILYNSAVAMTGGQVAVGGLPIEGLVALLQAEGVTKIVVTTENVRKLRRSMPADVQVRGRDDIVAAQSELATIRGVTVLIHDQECAAEKRRKRRRGTLEAPALRVAINERVCEGCGDCGSKSNCLSVQPVETEFGRKTKIDQSSCNVDYSCLSGDCPSFLTVRPGKHPTAPGRAALDPDDLPGPVQRFSSEHFKMRITGVGGTGVVTITQILATAAVLDGRYVRTLDQTGLAQKGGAVVSDLKISTMDVAQASKLADGQCDLYLGCDSLVATDPANLVVADPQRTIAIVSTSRVATGQMVSDVSLPFPGNDSVAASMDSSCAQTTYLDALALARQWFGDEQYANVLLMGAAFQAGTIPITADSIESAITLNGVTAEQNIQAFRRGRHLIIQRPTAAEPPAPLTAVALLADLQLEAGSELQRLLDRRVTELVAYQGTAYAHRFLRAVADVQAHEQRAIPGSTAIAEAAAISLHKLMAYKDEYEVARLSLDPELRAGVEAEFGAGSTFSYQLHPPVLRALGMNRKITLGPWFRPVFEVLYRMRRIRGTVLDVFGYAKVRRVERALIGGYRASLTSALEQLTPLNAQTVLAIAALPDCIRGYENIKLANVAVYHQKLAALQHELLVVPSQVA